MLTLLQDTREKSLFLHSVKGHVVLFTVLPVRCTVRLIIKAHVFLYLPRDCNAIRERPIVVDCLLLHSLLSQRLEPTSQ
jgi:hypothetical protein